MNKKIFIIFLIAVLFMASSFVFFLLEKRGSADTEQQAAQGKNNSEDAASYAGISESFIDLENFCYGISIAGQHVYAGTNNAIYDIDISDTESPHIKRVISPAVWKDRRGWAVNPAAEGDIVYACPNHWLDIIGTEGFKIISSLPVEGFDLQPAKSGGMLFIKASVLNAKQEENAGLFAIDISRHAEPKTVSSLSFEDKLYAVETDGKYVFLGGTGCLYVIKAEPELEIIQKFEFEGWINDIALCGDRILAATDRGLDVFKTGKEGAIKHIGGLDLGGFGQKIAVEKTAAYMLIQKEAGSSLAVIDISSEPHLILEQPFEGAGGQLAAADGIAVISSAGVLQYREGAEEASHVPCRLYFLRTENSS